MDCFLFACKTKKKKCNNESQRNYTPMSPSNILPTVHWPTFPVLVIALEIMDVSSQLSPGWRNCSALRVLSGSWASLVEETQSTRQHSWWKMPLGHQIESDLWSGRFHPLCPKQHTPANTYIVSTSLSIRLLSIHVFYALSYYDNVDTKLLWSSPLPDWDFEFLLCATHESGKFFIWLVKAN